MIACACELPTICPVPVRGLAECKTHVMDRMDGGSRSVLYMLIDLSLTEGLWQEDAFTPAKMVFDCSLLPACVMCCVFVCPVAHSCQLQHVE